MAAKPNAFLSFENKCGRTCYTIYYLPLIEIKNFNLTIDRRNLKKINSIWKIAD